jgi:pimeloyl-ACP methyl ester carboxylesterase
VNKFFLCFLPAVFFAAACSNIQDGEEVLYLKTENSYLPIYVRGNSKASTYIIWTHGGPGSSGMYYGDIDEIKVLHKDYRVVYWDQMGSGGTTGNPDKSDYNIDEFSRHQEGVVNIVRNRYHPDNLFLLGHSWGGFLASYYLIARGDATEAGKRQKLFDGLILLNPVLDIGRSIKEGISYIRDDYAPARIAAEKDVLKWMKALSWYDSHVKDGVLYGDDVSTHYQYIEDAGGLLVQRDRNDELTSKLTPKMVFFSPFHFYDYYNNQNTIRTYLDIADKSLAEEGKPNLSSITVPTLFIAGENDKIAFDYMSREWFDMMGFHSGTAAERAEYFKMYDNCAHAAFLDAPQQFQEDVTTFIENHR